MKKLEEKEWGKFKVFSDNGLFNISATNSSIDGIRLKEGDKDKLPYITRTDGNNGIAKFVSEENLSFGYDKAGCITVGLDTQTAFYQPHKFVTGQNIQIISGKNITEKSAQFFVPLLKKQMQAKFNWGGNGATLGRMKSLELNVPTDNSGNPDYAYMEEFSSVMRKAKLDQYKEFVKKRLKELGEYVEIPKLEEKEWKPFNISGLFKTTKRNSKIYMPTGTLIDVDLIKEGKIPRIRVTAMNNGINGITKRINSQNFRTFKNFVSVSFLGSAFYHPYEASLDMKVHCLQFINHKMTVFLGMFIAVAMKQNVIGTNYGNQLSSEDLAKKMLLLPTTDFGDPDYAYMEQYSKNMMLKKYRQYLAFLDKKL